VSEGRKLVEVSREAAGAKQVDGERLEAVLQELFARGRAAWPALDVPVEAFAHHLAAVCEPGEGAVDQLRALKAEDLYLACGCALGVPAAVAVLDDVYLRQVKVFLGRTKSTPDFIDDALQALRMRLLVASAGATPKITEYSGRGALTSWLRVVAVRVAVDLQRGADERPREDDEEAVEALAAHVDPELSYLKERYRTEFKEAFQVAFAELTSKQRNILRLHLIDGLSIDQIGVILGVHRSTAARWIALTREAILAHAQRLLEERLRLRPGEFESLARLLHSQLDISITRLLTSPDARRVAKILAGR
jgi:RNA polymerase sigma-70 factor, ECF subfamily